MRPVDRNGAPPGARTYEEMRPTLMECLGQYCSYCEYPVKHVAHVEHIVPKDLFKEYRDRWDNLLVSCSWCNGRKGKKRPRPESVPDYLWPTRDNTALAFTYANVIPEVADALTGSLRDKAARLRGLVVLGCKDDDRAKERASVFAMAQRYFSKLPTSPDPDLLRESIVDLALKSGFFSVWMTVCSSDASLRRRLIHAFPGTARDCFDSTAVPIPRPGGRV